MKIALDVDGVVADFIGGVLKVVPHVNRTDLTVWNIWNKLSSEDGEVVRAALMTDEFWLTLQPIREALYGVDDLRLRGHDVVFVTAPYDSHRNWPWCRHRWLERFALAKTFDEIVITHHKWEVVADLFIDDRHSNVETYQRHHPSALAVLFDNAHNRLDFWPRRVDWATLRLIGGAR